MDLVQFCAYELVYILNEHIIIFVRELPPKHADRPYNIEIVSLKLYQYRHSGV